MAKVMVRSTNAGVFYGKVAEAVDRMVLAAELDDEGLWVTSFRRACRALKELEAME